MTQKLRNHSPTPQSLSPVEWSLLHFIHTYKYVTQFHWACNPETKGPEECKITYESGEEKSNVSKKNGWIPGPNPHKKLTEVCHDAFWEKGVLRVICCVTPDIFQASTSSSARSKYVHWHLPPTNVMVLDMIMKFASRKLSQEKRRN